MKKILLCIIPLALTACAQISVPLGADAKYGTILVGYQPPANLPYGIQPSKTLRDK